MTQPEEDPEPWLSSHNTPGAIARRWWAQVFLWILMLILLAVLG